MAINVEAFYDMIDSIADKRVSATPMDLTIDAEVTQIKDVTIGEYKVEYQGSVFSAFNLEPTITYNVGERIYVLVPQGDFSTKKIILGRSAYGKDSTYEDLQSMTNFYIDQGPNWVDDSNYKMDHQPLQICAVPGASKQSLKHNNGEGANWEDEGFRRWTVADELEKIQRELDQFKYDRDKVYQENVDKRISTLLNIADASRGAATFLTDEEIQKVDARFTNYAKAFEWLKIQGDFRTDFHSSHKAGKYTLKVSFIAKNPNYTPSTGDEDTPGEAQEIINKGEMEYEIVTYELSFKDFVGSPYQMPVFTPQKGYFKILDSELIGLYRIVLEQDGNFQWDFYPTYDEEGNLQLINQVDGENNIFCDNLDIRFCRKVNLLDTLYTCWIEAPQGDAVYGPNTIEPDGRPTVDLIPHFWYQKTEVTSDCEVFWFREDLSVTKATPDPEEADKYGRVWTDYTGPGWRPIEHYMDGSDKKYFVSKDSHTLTITKEAIPWERRYKLVCVYKEGVYDSDIITIRNTDSQYDLFLQRFMSDNSKYHKLRINDNKHLVNEDPLRISTDGDEKIVKYYPEWFGTWYVQLPDESYEVMTNETFFVRGPVDITTYLNQETVTFRVACYDPLLILPPDGEGEIYEGNQYEEVGYLSLTLNNVDDLSLLVDWIGRKQFNYTATGNAYPNVSKNEYTLQPKLRFQDAELSTMISIIAPDGAVLGSRDFYNPDNEKPDMVNVSGQGHDPEGSMMTDMWVDSDNVVHFKVRQELEETRTLNTLIARVHTIQDDKYFEAPCEVIFTKDGQQGTQGSEWSAPIDFTNSKESRKTRWDGISKQYYYSAEPAFTQHLALPTYPLIVDKFVENGKTVYRDSGEHEIYLRPFPMKEGRDLMSYKEEGVKYKIETVWDVTYGQSALCKRARGASFLRLYHPGTHTLLSTTPPANAQSRLDTSKVNPRGDRGLVGITVWDGSQRDATDNEFYGAVQVKFWDTEFNDGDRLGDKESEQDDPLLEIMKYNFVVRATVNIYTTEERNFRLKGYDHDYYEHAEGTFYCVKTIVAYMPVDVFIREGGQTTGPNGQAIPQNRPKFNPTMCTVNWPIDMQYDSRGYCPTVADDYLEFYYGFYPDRERKDAGQFKRPYNKTPAVQSVVEESNFASNGTDSNPAIIDQNASSDSRNTLRGWKLKPRAHLNWQEGTVGTLYAKFEEEGEETPRGTFYRNQVYTVNTYDNVDINSWDGQSIDINEDNGTIFAPTIGAGYKLPTSNKFTGVLMGVNLGFRKDGTYGKKVVNQEEFSGINQLAQVGQSNDEQNVYPYMTGLFGYQDGYSSFGLLENGTAFFGRADRGGRIIIDGYNATIYGGANGVLASPSIGDPMWNNLRITLVDLSHATSAPVNDEDAGYERQDDTKITYDPDGNPFNQGEVGNMGPVTTPVQGIYQGFSGSYFGNENKNRRDPYGVSQKLPFWYEQTWRGAYLKPKGKAPYFLQESDGEQTVSAYITTEEKYNGLSANGHALYRPKKDIAPWMEELTEEQLEDFYIAAEGKSVNPKENNSYGSIQLLAKRRNIAIDYWEPNLTKVRAYMKSYYREWCEKDAEGNERISETQNVTGFGPSRASTTPAIEIGQHPPGLMPGPIPWEYSLDDIFADLFIPGDRNFMVTYDGTMWAMNGVFLGNILGSNIVGGRIRGAEIGIGDKKGNKYDTIYYPLGYTDDWRYLTPPVLGAIDISKMAPSSFYVNSDGVVWCKDIYIYGGSLSLGRFHVLGTHDINGADVDEDEQGHLIQFGHSDFVGPTHMYGGLGIGPDLGGNSIGKYNEIVGSQQGNLFQTRGLTALGIIIPQQNTEFHAIYAEALSSPNNVGLMTGDSLTYFAEEGAVGDPGIQRQKTVEQTAMFAVNTRCTKTIPEFSGGAAEGGDRPKGELDVGVSQNEFMEEWQEWDRNHRILQALCGGEQEAFDYMYSRRDFFRKVLGSLLPGFTWGSSTWDGSNFSNAVNFNGPDYKKLAAAAAQAIGKLPTGEDGTSGIPPVVAGGEADGYMGHFWPMAYRYYLSGIDKDDEQQANTQQVNGFMTTMNIFKSKPFVVSNGTNDKGKDKSPIDGGNYFRVGPWGQEGMRYYICSQWQDENDSNPPTVDRNNGETGKGVRGFMGLVNRAGDGSQNPISMAIGMTSWGKAPIILKSDSEFAVRSKNSNWQYALSAEHYADNNLDETSDWSDHQIVFGGGSIMPSGGGSGSGQPSFQANVTGEQNPYIKFQITKGKSWADKSMNGHHTGMGIAKNSTYDLAGLTLDPMNAGQLPDGGTYLYARKGDIHIIRIKENEEKLCYDKKGGVTEALFKEDEIVLYASKKVTIGWGEEQSAHIENESEWKHAAIFKDKGITIINNGDPSSSDQGQGGGGSTPPTLAKPGDKKYCIYLGAQDNRGGTSEITWQEHFIGIAAKQVAISGGGSPAHTPRNYMLFAQNSIDMKGAYATPDNQFHIYARFG